MKFFSAVFAIFVAAFCSVTGFAQCCCSKAEFVITDGGGQPLKSSDVTIKDLVKEHEGSFSVRKKTDQDEARVLLPLGCGTGREAMVIEYMGVEMRVRFKLYGEFGRPKGEVAFLPGDYVAEIDKAREDGGDYKLVFRLASEEEMKEIGRPAESNGTSDQTAYSFRPDPESSGNTRFSNRTGSIWHSPTPLFSPYRNG